VLNTLAARGVLSPLDRRFAAALLRVAGETRSEIELAAALASRAVGQGHVCLDLGQVSERAALVDEAGEPVYVVWPETAAWTRALEDSALVALAGDAAASPARPLILDRAGRLYLRRYWEYQRSLAAALHARAAVETPDVDFAAARRALARLYPDPAGDCDWQRVATAMALLRRFCVISGGPGTGKTFTVVKILALLIEQARRIGGAAPRIALLAPTGKAAARLVESVRAATPRLACDDEIRDGLLSLTASTVHRALGSRSGSSRFARDAGNPLLADVVLVDEASMIDLALMARLVAAVPAGARLILLGDKDQLASVEAGAVLADICREGRGAVYSPPFAQRIEQLSGDHVPADSSAAAISDCSVQLTRSYRYAADSGIGALARAVNDGDAEAVLRVLDDPACPEVRLCAVVPGGELGGELSAAVRRCFAPLMRAEPHQALAALASFRVLCALRRGPLGVEGMNRRIEELLRAERRLEPEDDLYSGRPIMVTRNDYQLSLFNGDVGVVVASRAERPWVAFPAAAGTLRRVAALHLPEHETVYAASVHKSQGSEFDEVAVVLPEHDSPLLTRELLYTAVTRARHAVTIYASPVTVAAAVARRVERASGLRDLLWETRRAAGEQLALRL
jgi:exodeoxyribonuclease V alpha subunit